MSAHDLAVGKFQFKSRQANNAITGKRTFYSHPEAKCNDDCKGPTSAIHQGACAFEEPSIVGTADGDKESLRFESGCVKCNKECCQFGPQDGVLPRFELDNGNLKIIRDRHIAPLKRKRGADGPESGPPPPRHRRSTSQPIAHGRRTSSVTRASSKLAPDAPCIASNPPVTPPTPATTATPAPDPAPAPAPVPPQTPVPPVYRPSNPNSATTTNARIPSFPSSSAAVPVPSSGDDPLQSFRQQLRSFVASTTDPEPDSLLRNIVLPYLTDSRSLHLQIASLQAQNETLRGELASAKAKEERLRVLTAETIQLKNVNSTLFMENAKLKKDAVAAAKYIAALQDVD